MPDVADLPLRPPPMLAKAAATLDVLTGGRAELAVGAGAFWVETLAEWVTDLGVDSFVFWPADPTEQQVRTFAEDVVPQVRQRVESERSRTSART